MTTSPKIVVGVADGVPKATVAISAKMPEAKVNIHVTTDTDGLASKEYVDKKIAEIEFEAHEETDPTVPAWAKQPEKPTYTAEEVGAQPKGDYALKSELPDVPVKSVNGQTGAVVLNAGNVGADAAGKAAEEAGKALNEAKGYTDQEIKKIPTPDVSAQINQHNENAQAHPAIRELITQLTARLNALMDSDDVTLDQLSEIVAYIKSNKSLIDAITTSKVSVGDIINNLTTSAAAKPLSAAQGVVLKTMIEAITVPTMLSQLTGDATHRTVTDAEKAAWDAKSEFSGAYADLTGKPTIPTVPTKVSAFENDKGYLTAVPAEYVTETELNGKGYLTQHQDISHKLDASALPGAINEALEQAKESGEFDGEDGMPATHSWNGTVLTVTSASGTSSADLKGEKGDPGDPAGVTAENVREALGYTPADVADVFENANRAMFVNQLEDAGIEYGKLINITDKTIEDTAANLATTGFIPVNAGSVVRVNEDFRIAYMGTPAYILYDSGKNPLLALRMASITSGAYNVELVESDSDGYIRSFVINKPSSTAYIRITNDSRLIGKNPVLTVDEEIVYEMGYGEKLNPNVKVEHSQIVNAPGRNGWSILPNEHLSICYSGINRKPINTVEHFTDAAENFGYNALKCDVRPTSDGELICCHDAGFTFDANGYITAYDSGNQTLIHDVTAATCLGYAHRTGEHPCLVGDYLDVCRKYGKVAFVTIRNEYMDIVIPKLLDELRIHNMTYSTIINCMTYESLVQWRQQDQAVMINYTLNFGVAIDQTQIDRAIGLGYCSICGFSLSSASTDPSASCDFEYARANGIRLLEAIAYKEGSPEACFALGYDGCQIGIPWGTPSGGGMSEDSVQAMIDNAIGAAIGGAY